MSRLYDCQLAVVPWGHRAKFRRARVGLLKKSRPTAASGSSSSIVTVYLASFFHSNDSQKFPIDKNNVEILPAAIRFKDLKKDIFIREVSDEQRFQTMMREIRIILRKDKLAQTPGKADAFERYISSIPNFSSINPRELVPARLSAHIVCESSSPADNTTSRRLSISSTPATNHNDSILGVNNNNSSATSVLNSLRRLSPSRLDQRQTSSDVLIDKDNPDQSFKQSSFKQGAISCRRNQQTRDSTVSDGYLPRECRQRLENNKLKCIKICGLERLPEQLWLRQSIHEITLTNCQLKTVPKQLETFSATLNFLDLSNNQIINLPRTFCCKMNNLNALNLSNNSIETLPIEIKFFRRLVDFDISNNRLRMLPSTFSDLKSLRNLNVANNNLSQLPAFRKEQIRLKELDVSHNPLDGALNEFSTFEVYPSFDGHLGYYENLICNHPLTSPDNPQNSQAKPIPSLFEMSMLKIVRCDKLLKLASEESLPQTIVSTMQRDIFKCYRCNLMNILPAYNSTDILDYVDQVEILTTTGNYRHGMTFMKLLCRTCFDNMSS